MSDTDIKPLRYVLQIEVRARKGRHKEVWAKTETMPISKHCAKECQPLILEYQVEGPFGMTRKRERFELETWDVETSTATYKEASFARSEWFYQNLYNFDFQPEKTQ